MANKELSDAEIDTMEETVRNARARQQAARDKANAERLVAESKTNIALREFVGSDQYKQFVEAASAVAAAHTGMPLVQHLVGALTSLSVVSAETSNAEQNYEAAAEALKAKDADL